MRMKNEIEVNKHNDFQCIQCVTCEILNSFLANVHGEHDDIVEHIMRFQCLEHELKEVEHVTNVAQKLDFSEKN